MLTISLTCSTYYCIFFSFHSFANQFGHDDRQGYGSFMHRWTKWYGIVNKAVCSTKESVTNADELEEWTHTVLIPTLEGYSPRKLGDLRHVCDIHALL